MKIRVLGLLVLLGLGLSTSGRAAGLPTPSRVLIIYNSNFTRDDDRDGVQDSLEVAQYYAQKRGVPASNILGLPLSTDSGYGDFATFKQEMIVPIQAKLAQLGPLNIDILLMCYGTPISYHYDSGLTTSMSLDSALMGLNAVTGPLILGFANPYLLNTPTFTPDVHFDHSFKFSGTDMYLVTRIDGPRGVTGALDLIDQALYADLYLSGQSGYYKGNAYVDSENLTGANPYDDAYLAAQIGVTYPYSSSESADVNIAYTEHYVNNSPNPFPLKWEQTGALIGMTGTRFQDGTSAESAPKALFYSGWYNFNRYMDVYDWLPGSVADDLDSLSLSYLRWGQPNPQHTGPWGTEALFRGATCVSGVIDEPFLSGHPRPNVLAYAMLQGYSFAEAAGMATPTIGWVQLNVGDPLYAPLRPGKPLVRDTQAPVLTPGYPFVVHDNATGTMIIHAMVNDSPEPEVVKVIVDYGLTTGYGQTANSDSGYFRRPITTLAGLIPGQTYHYRLHLIDPVGNSITTGDYTLTTPIQTPYGGTPLNLPGTIQAENFDNGGDGVAYHEILNFGDGVPYRPDNMDYYNVPGGGYSVGSLWQGEWMDYTVNVTASGSYTPKFRLSSLGPPAAFHLEVDGVNVTGLISAPNTGGWDSYQIVPSAPFALSAGPRILRLFIDAADGGIGQAIRLDWIQLTNGSGNQPPTANSQSITTAFNTAKAITLVATDPQALPLTYSILSGPSHGTLSGTAPNVTYTPNAGYGGADSFTFKANNGVVDSNVATVSLTINGPPAPTANNQSVATFFNTAKAMTLTASDPLGLPLSYTLLTNPAHGTLSGMAPNLTYTPNSNYTGSDSFTFKVNNGYLDSPVATVSIAVNSPSAPTAQNQTVTTAFNTAKAITLVATDPQALPLTYSIVTGPAHGTLSGSASNVTYTPNNGYMGADSFTFKANNGVVDSNVATVRITVSPTTNHPPVANNQSLLVQQDQVIALTLLATDADGDVLTYRWVDLPVHGSLTGTPPQVVYHPLTGYSGPDSFTFKANDGKADSNLATISITLTSTPSLLPPDLSGLDGKTFTVRDDLTIAYSGSATRFNWEIDPLPSSSSGSSRVILRTGASATGITTAAVITSVPRLSLTSLSLTPGIYLVKVQAVSGSQASGWATATVTLVSADLTSVRVYPNPWRADKHNGRDITFNSLTDNTNVKIFTTSGHLVKDLGTVNVSVQWNLTNNSGEKVASGLYPYLITDSQGNKTHGKLAVIR